MHASYSCKEKKCMKLLAGINANVKWEGEGINSPDLLFHPLLLL